MIGRVFVADRITGAKDCLLAVTEDTERAVSEVGGSDKIMEEGDGFMNGRDFKAKACLEGVRVIGDGVK